MNILYVLIAFVILAASPPCGMAPGSSAGAYGFGPEPQPSETVKTDGNVVTVYQALGDRMFTDIVTRYNASNLMLLSSERRASCCLTSWISRIMRNPDGTYDVESQTTRPSPHGDDIQKERMSHLQVHGGIPIVVAGFFFVPWLHHITHASRVARIDFDPLRVEYVTISDASSSPYPDGVPARDKALRASIGGQTTTLWYDPCTFTLDAYGTSDVAIVRSALLQ